MAKFTIGFEDYDEPTWEEYTGPDPKVGTWHTAELKKVQHKADDEALLFIFEIAEGDFAGWGRGYFAPYTGDRKWKSQQALRAVQGGQTKAVTLDWDNDKAVDAWIKKQKRIRIKIGEYNDRINIDKVAPLIEAVGSTPAAKKAAAPLAEPEPVEDDEPAEDYTEEELAAMSADDLEEILSDEFDVAEDDLPAKPRRDPKGEKYKQALIDAILEEQEADPNQDAVEDAAEAGDEDGDEEFDDGFEEGEDEEPEPEPEPAPRARRSRAAATPAKAAPAKAAPAARRRRG